MKTKMFKTHIYKILLWINILFFFFILPCQSQEQNTGVVTIAFGHSLPNNVNVLNGTTLTEGIHLNKGGQIVITDVSNLRDSVQLFYGFFFRLQHTGIETDFDIEINIANQGWEKTHGDDHVEETLGLTSSSMFHFEGNKDRIDFRITANNTIDLKKFEVFFQQKFIPEPEDGPQGNLNQEVPNRINLTKGNLNNLKVNSCNCSIPSYYTRAQYGVNNNGAATCPFVTATPITHLIIHHEGNPGSQTSSNWAQRAYGIWWFHFNNHPEGYCDVAYNWLLAPNGNLYEGRWGSASNNVRGAHMCGEHNNKLGVCIMGDWSSGTPPAECFSTLYNLLAWKACEFNIDPFGSGLTGSYTGTMNNISGHKDGCSPGHTTCPGNIYNSLSTIRNGVSSKMNSCGGSSPLVNDNPCDVGVPTLPVGTSCIFPSTYTNVGATNSNVANLTNCDGTSNGDVWFKFVVPTSGRVIINTNAGTINDMGMALYTGSSCGSLSYYGCYPNGSTYSQFMPYADVSGLTPGTTMWIRMWEFNNNNFGTFSICVSSPSGCSTPSAPSVSVSPTTICSGSSATLSATNCSGTVTWSGGAGVGTSVSVSPAVGTYTYTATCTVSGCTSGNSSPTGTLTVNNCPTLPDLIINTGTQSVTPTTVSAGSTITASTSQSNIGSAIAGSSVVGLWLSNSSTLNTGTATYLGNITGYPSLQSGFNSAILSNTVTIPSTTPTGTYYMFFGADGGTCTTSCTTCGGAVSESNECNNFASVQLNVTGSATLCTTCPTYDFNYSPTTVWQTHSSNIPVSGCKIYRFSVTNGNTYTFKTGCGDGATANFDTFLELLNGNCSSIASNDDACSGLISTITWQANYSGYVYLKVRGFDTGSGTYTLAYNYTSSCTTPSTPTTNSPTNITQTSFQANWSAVGGNPDYVLEYSTNPNFPSNGFTSISVGNVTAYSVSNLTCNTPYFYRVKAYTCSQSAYSLNMPVSTNQCSGGVGVPANDNCANAQLLISNSTCINTPWTVAGATPSGFLRISCDGASGAMNDVWFKFQVPIYGNYEIITTPSFGLNPVVALYRTSCTDNQLGCVSPRGSGVQIVDAGNYSPSDMNYYRIYGYGTNTTNDFNICVRFINALNPQGFTLSSPSNTCNTITNNITLQWSEARGASYYEIFNGNNSILQTSNTQATFVVTDNTPYSLTVRAINSNGFTLNSGGAVTITTRNCSCIDNPTLPTYNSGNVVQIKAPNTINATNRINAGANILYQAGRAVTLNAGFTIESGAVFKAQMGGCNN